jgi:fermentation-respiration switch protein FrsA (DUF1100 family)
MSLADHSARRPHRWRRTVLLVLTIAAIVVLLAYGAASAYVYNSLSAVQPCEGKAEGNVPTSFTVVNDLTKQPIDVTPYLMPEPQDIRFASRGAAELQIAAWWIPSNADEDAPAIILVHGQFSCRHEREILLAAGMLHRNGYSTLLIDLRDHGDSTIEDGRYAAGSEEYLDALGAFDWLRARGVPAAKIGIIGLSLGAGTAINAAGEEAGIAALWEDSGFADIEDIIRDELARSGFPTILGPGGVLVGRIVTGDDLTAHSPLDEIAAVAGRPIFITHGAADSRIAPRYANALADAVRANGGTVDPWIVANAEHTRAITIETDEYEERLVSFFDGALRAPGE